MTDTRYEGRLLIDGQLVAAGGGSADMHAAIAAERAS